MTAKRAVIRIQMDISAKRAIDQISERQGMTQIALLSRVVLWIASQEDLLQASVLELLSDTALTAMAKLEMGREIASKVPD